MVLYITDLDGTLLNMDQEIEREAIGMINDLINQGLHFSIATARSYHSAWPIINEIDFKVPLVFHNGSYIYNPIDKEMIHSELITPRTYQKVLDTFLSNDISPFVYTGDKNNYEVIYEKIHNEGQKLYADSKYEEGDPRFVGAKSFKDVISSDVSTILGIGDKEILDGIYDELIKIPEITLRYDREMYTGWYWLEATSDKADKEHAIKYFKEKTGFNKIVCFGDASNDIGMFSAADVSIAVSNASDEVKDEADFVINNDDSLGVVKYLRKQFKKP